MAKVSVSRDLNLGEGLFLPECNVYVLQWGKDLVSMVLGVVLCLLLALTLKFEPGHDAEDVPFQLQKGVSLAGAKGTESGKGVLQFFSILVELGIDKSVIFELLQHTEEKTYISFIFSQEGQF